MITYSVCIGRVPAQRTIRAVDRVEAGWRVYGYDAGWNDPRVVIEVGKTPAGQLVALGEFYEQETHVDDAIGWLADRPTGRIYAEHVPGEIERLRRETGHRVERAEKDLDLGLPRFGTG